MRTHENFVKCMAVVDRLIDKILVSGSVHYNDYIETRYLDPATYGVHIAIISGADPDSTALLVANFSEIATELTAELPQLHELLLHLNDNGDVDINLNLYDNIRHPTTPGGDAL